MGFGLFASLLWLALGTTYLEKIFIVFGKLRGGVATAAKSLTICVLSMGGAPCDTAEGPGPGAASSRGRHDHCVREL